MNYKGFIGGDYQSQSFTADQEQTINWYEERMESEGATTTSALYPTPGVSQVAVVGSGAGRGHFFLNGREFGVFGNYLWEITQAGVVSTIAAVATNSNPATISSNGDGGNQLFITSGDNGYIYNLTTGAFSQVVFLNGKATMGAMLDGFFLALDATTSTLYISNLLDGLTWQSTQFARRSISPDRWVSMKVLGRYIWLMGRQTSEVWYNAGTSPFPFAAHPSGLVSNGCEGQFSVATSGNEIIWLGGLKDGPRQVLRASGFSPEVISSYPLSSAMTDYATIRDAVGETYLDRGHMFYILTFPTQDVTWVWDSETRKWAQRGTWISEQNKYVASRQRFLVYAFGEHRILDSSTGSLYRMSTTYTDDVDSRPIRRLRRAPAISNENKRVFYSAFELDLDRAVASATGQGSDPQVMLRMSPDYGKTWGTERMMSAGKVGEYGKRVIANRCGQARGRVFEVSVTDPVAWKITGAYLTLGQTAGRRKAG